jgi:hypothetical protein
MLQAADISAASHYRNQSFHNHDMPAAGRDEEEKVVSDMVAVYAIF